MLKIMINLYCSKNSLFQFKVKSIHKFNSPSGFMSSHLMCSRRGNRPMGTIEREGERERTDEDRINYTGNEEVE